MWYCEWCECESDDTRWRVRWERLNPFISTLLNYLLVGVVPWWIYRGICLIYWSVVYGFCMEMWYFSALGSEVPNGIAWRTRFQRTRNPRYWSHLPDCGVCIWCCCLWLRGRDDDTVFYSSEYLTFVLLKLLWINSYISCDSEIDLFSLIFVTVFCVNLLTMFYGRGMFACECYALKSV